MVQWKSFRVWVLADEGSSRQWRIRGLNSLVFGLGFVPSAVWLRQRVISVLGCHSQRKKGLCRAFCGVQWVLSEVRAELDFCTSVVSGDVNIYFFSPVTQVDCSCCPESPQTVLYLLKCLCFHSHCLRMSFHVKNSPNVLSFPLTFC